MLKNGSGMCARGFLVLAVLLVTGCQTSSMSDIVSVTDSYAAIVFDNGISLQESKIIAQKELIKKNVIDIYGLTMPEVYNDASDLSGHEKYWFIFFKEKRPSNIPFVYVIVIDRKTGRVKFSEDFNEGNDWILESALLHIKFKDDQKNPRSSY